MSKTKVLLVDDRPENILVLSNLIGEPEVEILSALSANEALSLLLDHEVALALLDVQMPVMGGFELGKLMRGSSRLRHIPIIFVTATNADLDVIIEGYDAGAVDFLLKPLVPQIVRSKVALFVELDQRRQALQESRALLQRQLGQTETLRVAADAASRAKSQFVANMSHEIRTPLGAMLGFAELLQANIDGAPEDRASCIEAIIRNGHHLLGIVNDVLDFAKIESGQSNLAPSTFSFSDLLGDLETNFRAKARQKGLDLQFRGDGPLPRRLTTDATKLRQILTNIVGNAIKFTERGGVEVVVAVADAAPGGAALDGDGAGASPVIRSAVSWPPEDRPAVSGLSGATDGVSANGRSADGGAGDSGPAGVGLSDGGPTPAATVLFRVSIHDTGCGMTPEAARHLFEPFSQADTSATRQYGGTGLGLAIARELARKLGGDIALARSELGRGSTFVLTFRAARAADEPFVQLQDVGKARGKAAPSSPAPTRLSGVRILVAEDTPDCQIMVRRILERQGASVDCVSNGREAYEKASANGPYDVILMDVQMPELDGCQATAKLRRAGYRAPIFALTAHALKQQRDECLQAGCDLHLSKPITQSVLVGTIAGYLAEQGAAWH